MLTVSLMDKRPPFVRFEEREYGRNAELSEKAGRPIPNVAVFACITPFGSKDEFHKPAEEWIADIKRKASTGEYPHEWVAHFTAQYEGWKQGQEVPRDGTAIKTWSALTKEQAIRLIALGITTVEDLAMIPDSGLGQIGLDGRVLRDLGRAWINEAKDKGINAQKIAEQSALIEQQSQSIAALEKQVAELRAMAEGRKPRKD